jgi:hypothetical protein
MIVNTVTFTGADDKTDIQKMRYLSTLYPCDLDIEYGILFSTKPGRSRYPSDKWINDLVFYCEELNLSAHLCGDYAKQVLVGDDVFLKEIRPYFKRFQINHNFSNNPIGSLEPLMEIMSKSWDKKFILQLNKSNRFYLETLVEKIRKKYGWNTRYLQFLYDSSGGRGTEIKTFEPSFNGLWTGYAGGLGPDNIHDVYNKLYDVKDELVLGTWVDMESKVRNENDEFDLEICKQVLKNLKYRF